MQRNVANVEVLGCAGATLGDPKFFFPIWRDRDDEVEALRGNLFERSAAKYFDILCDRDVDAALCEENPDLALIRRRVPIEFNEKERMDFGRRSAQLDPGR